jgi:hypothetical protein
MTENELLGNALNTNIPTCHRLKPTIHIDQIMDRYTVDYIYTRT